VGKFKFSKTAKEQAANAEHNFGCLPKYNYSLGAGWKSCKGSSIGNRPSGTGGGSDNHAFAIRRKRRG
jgi:hypothetical protein